MMSKSLLFAIIILISITPAHAAVEKRCGWFDNPSPGNVYLNDKDGSWIINEQNRYDIEADWTWPEFSSKQQVKTGSHGYGCVCMDVETKTEDKAKYITAIKSTKIKPLSVCRKDKTLIEPNH